MGPIVSVYYRYAARPSTLSGGGLSGQPGHKSAVPKGSPDCHIFGTLPVGLPAAAVSPSL